MKGRIKKMPKVAGGGLGDAVNDPKPVDGGGDPDVVAKAKKKTIGMIDGETKHTPRMDKRPRRASGGSVMAPGAAKHPMATAAKGSSGPKKSSHGGY